MTRIECPVCGSTECMDTDCIGGAVKRPPGYWTVAVYSVDRAYGGPEEGGWYYTHGDIVRRGEFMVLRRSFLTREEAGAYALSLNCGDLLKGENAGKPSIYSVLSEGALEARVFEGEAPATFPATRPHFE